MMIIIKNYIIRLIFSYSIMNKKQNFIKLKIYQKRNWVNPNNGKDENNNQRIKMEYGIK